MISTRVMVYQGWDFSTFAQKTGYAENWSTWSWTFREDTYKVY